ncbi:MAG TPA: M23 family metallopeptidase [Bacillota bacterium]|mgnify:CR=1 FL=1|nr:M23 family metallopeptidase [Peptococcaceae bacterium MAG4]NLW37699.1 peptidoglycan DD-metalloendopeptidase family protein [Peptococcaceae bacterium]HQD75443.1 M23 family metallopeptidase [Bacillota bacterium]HUM59119.1 M23 family metallopeptidase [Bacillota bacterium]
MPPEFEGARRLPRLARFAPISGLPQWLSRQPVYRRVVLGAALCLILALTAYAIFGGNACAVYVNDKMVAVANDEKSAKQALAELTRVKSEQAGCPVVVTEDIAYRGIRVEQEEMLDQEALIKRLDESLTFQASCTSILVDGEARVFLKHREDAEGLLAWLKELYPLEPGESPLFKEKIELVEGNTDLNNIMDLESAKKYVLLGTNKVTEYKVKEGDTLWDIARAARLDMEQIILSNPGLDPDRLSIDQVLYLSKESPLINVVSKRQVTVDEEIPYSVEVQKDDSLLFGEQRIICKGVPGKRTVTYEIVRENGLETSREVLAEELISEPKKEIVAKGSLTMLASRGGSARLSWPCSGRIISPFGMRSGRMHEGADIGAGYGSPVKAAAGGTVTFTGWQGGYGNTVEISHGSGLVTLYAHLSSINVKNGEKVDRGEKIGLVGATGRASGPHLHFEVRIGGKPQNPANYLP